MRALNSRVINYDLTYCIIKHPKIVLTKTSRFGWVVVSQGLGR